MRAQGEHDVLPGSCGEHVLQEQYGTTGRARAFYDRQVLDHLNDQMQQFIVRQEMMFVVDVGRGRRV